MADGKNPQPVKIANPEELNEEKFLFSWEAAERAYQKRDRDFWITAVAILVLVSIILLFIKEFFLVIVLFSVLFLYYVLSTVPPDKISHKISNRGIYFGEVRYPWELLERFWFKQSLSTEVLEFETRLRFPRQITLVIDPKNKEQIKSIVLKRVPLVESAPNFVDKVTKWFGERLPLENRPDVNK